MRRLTASKGRRIFFTLSLFFLFSAYGLESLRYLFVSHHYCAAHGEMSHTESEENEPIGVEHTHHAVELGNPFSFRRGDIHTHCALLLSSRRFVLAVDSTTSETHFPSFMQTSVSFETGFLLPASIEPILLSPKNSPPPSA